MILIIANPTSGNFSKEKLDEVQKILVDKFKKVEVILTESRGHATEIVKNTTARIIISAGGDGLANEVAQSIAGTDKLFTVLPFGTANVFCCEYGINLNPIKAAKNLKLETATKIPVGYIDNKIFLLMIGFGFDAETVKKVEEKKHKFKKLAHILAGAKVIASNKYKPINILSMGADHIIYNAIISVVASYGGNFKLGTITQGRLNVFALITPKFSALFSAIFFILIGRGFRGVRAVADQLKIKGADYCQIDGEFMPITKSSVIISVKRNAINLVS